MARLTAPFGRLWDRTRKVRRIARVCAKITAIVLICLVVLYAVTRGVLFAWYNAKLNREMTRFEAAGGSRNIGAFIPPAGGRAPRLIHAAGMLYREPGDVEITPGRETTAEQWQRSARIGNVWDRYDNWTGFTYHRTRRASRVSFEWEAPWLPVLEEHISENAAVLSLAREAARIGEGAFDVNWHAGYQALLPHLTRLRSCARLVKHAAVLNAAKGDLDAAVEDVRLGFRFARLIADEPCLVSRLVSYACDSITCRALQGVLEFGAPSNEKLRAVLDELEGRENSYRLTQAFFMETAFGLDAIDRVRSDPSYLWSLIRPPDRRQLLTPYERILPKAVLLKLFWVEPCDRYHYLRIMNTYIEGSRMDLSAALDVNVTVRWSGYASAPFKVMTAVLTPALSRAIRLEAGTTAKVRLARTVIALAMFRNDHGERQAPSLQTEGRRFRSLQRRDEQDR
ncbi:MAG: hypothetical protein ACYTAN_16875 [Planctomycetota bacterium]|jgi:hypothetical protein